MICGFIVSINGYVLDLMSFLLIKLIKKLKLLWEILLNRNYIVNDVELGV